MACQRSTQTASNCQSNALSPFSRVLSPVSLFAISPYESPYESLHNSFDSPFSDSSSSGSTALAEQFAYNAPAKGVCRFGGGSSRQSAAGQSALATSCYEPLCKQHSSQTSHELSATNPKISTHKTCETFSPTHRSFGSWPPAKGSQSRSFFFPYDQQLCSALFKVSSAGFRVTPVLLIRLLCLVCSGGVLLAGCLNTFGSHCFSRNFSYHSIGLIELCAKLSELKRFRLALRALRTAFIQSETDKLSKQNLFEQPNPEQKLRRATISKQPDIIKRVSTNCRSFFKLWPFLFLRFSRLVLSKFVRRVRALPRNSAFQLLIILCISAAPVSANLKVSVQGDILLGGIFPVHQKGKRSANWYKSYSNF